MKNLFIRQEILMDRLQKIMPSYEWKLVRGYESSEYIKVTGTMAISDRADATINVDVSHEGIYYVYLSGHEEDKRSAPTIAQALVFLQAHYEELASKFYALSNVIKWGRNK